MKKIIVAAICWWWRLEYSDFELMLILKDNWNKGYQGQSGASLGPFGVKWGYSEAAGATVGKENFVFFNNPFSFPPNIAQTCFNIQNLRMDLSFQEEKNDLKIQYLITEILSKNSV